MRRRSTVLLAAVCALVLVAVAGGGWFLQNVVGPKGAGYHAKILCSAHFVAERDPGHVLATDLGRFWYVQSQVNEEDRSVTSSMFGFGSTTAVYRPGLGCTVVRGVSPDDLRASSPSIPAPRPTRALPWPTGDVGAEIQVPGEHQLRLSAVLDAAFSEGTRAVVVIHHGRIVAERYAPGFDADTPLVGWSMTKSVTAAMIGLAHGEGRIDLHGPARVPGWERDERARVTVDHLLRMSSGLRFDEVYGAIGDATQMLFVEPSAAEYAARFPAENAPDAVWSYSSGTTNVLQLVLRDALQGRYHSFARTQLFDPIGMESAVLEPDTSGVFVGSSFMMATARDWARFGLLHLQDGMWEGQRVLPPGWVAYVTTPTPPAPLRQYGAQWWLNAGDPDDPSQRRWPGVPTDAFDASGFEGQNILVVPSRDVVIVRLGLSPEGNWRFGDFAASVLDALPPDGAVAPPPGPDPVEAGPVDTAAYVHRGDAPYLESQAPITADDLRALGLKELLVTPDGARWSGHPGGAVALTFDTGLIRVERPDPTTVRWLLTLADQLDANTTSEGGARFVADPTSPRGFREVRPQRP